MKKLLVGVLSIVMAFGCLVGCAGGAQAVNVSGSSSVSPLMSKLAVEFEKKNKDIKIKIKTSDSSIGIKDTLEGKNDLGMVSRGLKSAETGLKLVKIADDGVVMIANKAADITGVTSEQVYNLYASGVAIGGVTRAISREEGSGTRDAFDGLIKNTDGKKLSEVTAFSDKVDVQNSTGLVMTEISTAAAKIGYISLGSLNDTVKALTFNGVVASSETIKAGTYALSRPFAVIMPDNKNISASAQKFIDFILSENGQKIVASSGYITL